MNKELCIKKFRAQKFELKFHPEYFTSSSLFLF